jgi:hypothetical protein
LPSIFPNFGKPAPPASNGLVSEEIGLKCKRRFYSGAELLIEFNKSFISYEIEIYSEKDSNPLIKCITDREIFYANNLEENKNYFARVRGVNEEHHIYTKWSKDLLFHSLGI